MAPRVARPSRFGEVRQIANELCKYPSRFYTCHCTGIAAHEEMKKRGIKGVNLITQGDGFLPKFYERHSFKKENEAILMGMEL